MRSTALDLGRVRSIDDAPLRFVSALFAAVRTRRLRGAADPRSQAALTTLLAATQAVSGAEPVRLVRRGPHLCVDRVRLRPTPESKLALRSLWQELEARGIGGFEFRGPVELDVMEAFLDAYLRPEPGRDESGSADSVREFSPGVLQLPPNNDPPPDREDPEAKRASARRTFFRALAAAHGVVRQVSSQRISELRKARAVVHEMVDTLVDEEFSLIGLSAIQDFDPYTFQHSVHVSVLSMALGQRLGLSRTDLAALGVAAMFHDMGKTRVPREVLRKPGRFDEQEWSVMRTHPLSGAREFLRLGAVSDLLIQVMLVSAEHHLRFDGSGYPRLGDAWGQGLFARVVTIADCYDAMTASRIYMKRPFTPDAVVRYLCEHAGRMFDPDLTRLFIGMIGLYPVGSLVRLESGELAVVLESPRGPEDVDRPRVAILGLIGSGLEPVETRALGDGPPVDPRYRIQAGCHPKDHGVDVDAVITRHYLDAA